MSTPFDIWTEHFKPGGGCELNQDGRVLQGCISNSDVPPVEVIDLGEDSILGPRGLNWSYGVSSIDEREHVDALRNASDSIKLAIVSRDESLLGFLRSDPPTQADIVVFPGQPTLPLHFWSIIWQDSRFYPGWDYRSAHVPGVDTSSTTVVLFRKHEQWEVEVDGPYHSQTGKKSSGIVNKFFVIDKRMSPFTGIRQGVLVVSSVVHRTEHLTGGDHDQDHGAFGLNIYGPQGEDMWKSTVRSSVINDIDDSVSKLTRNRTPVLVVASNDYFQGPSLQGPCLTTKLHGYGLRGFLYKENRIFFSPVMPSLTNAVVVNERGDLVLSMCKRALVDAHGSCCPMTPGGEGLHGYGKHNESIVAPTPSRNHVNSEYMQNLKGYRIIPNEYANLSAGDSDDVNIILGTDEIGIRSATESLANTRATVHGFDCEWANDVLATVSIAYNIGGDFTLLFFPLQHIMGLGGGLYQPVLAALRTFFSRDDIRLVGYDLSHDTKMLKSAGIKANSNILFDLKKEMGRVFPVAYTKYEGSPKTMATDLGLRHFVQMALSMNLIKDPEHQEMDWTNADMQVLPNAVNYAITDAYAVLKVYERYEVLLNALDA